MKKNYQRFNGCFKILASKITFFAMCVVCCATVCSCSDEYDNPGYQKQEVTPTDNTRIVFTDMDEFNAYLASQNNVASPVSCSPNSNVSDIMADFISSTSIGALLNDKLEIQVGDTIYKYSPSGYCIYAIQQTKYAEVCNIVLKENELLKNLRKYKAVEPGKYEISTGVMLYYTGAPVIISVKKQSVPLTRISDDGRTKVQTSFWVSTSPFMSSCGVKVEAWSKDNDYDDLGAADTDLELTWDIGYTIPMATLPNPSAGSLTGHGNIIKQQLNYCYGYFKFEMKAGTIIGAAKCWNGKWISATVTKN